MSHTSQKSLSMDEKVNQLSGLIALVLSDGEVTESEYEFLLRIATEMNVSQLELDMLIGKDITFVPPKSEFDRIVQFYRLLLLMHVDKKVVDKELILVKDLSIKMGLSPLTTDKLIDMINISPNKQIPADKLIAAFQVNHN